MSIVRVHNFSISLDGFGSGEPQSHDAPFGHAGERLHEWMFTTRYWREMVGEPGGTRGLDDAFARLHNPGIGAEIMGAGKFGYPGWHEDREWKGWWGPNPPFHTPVFVLTHHTRPPIEMEGGTTFHFLDVSPAEALETRSRGCGRTRPAHRWRRHRDPRPPRCGACGSHAHRRRPHPSRPRRSALGRTGGRREGLPGRGHLLVQRGHAHDVHPRGRLSRHLPASSTE